MVQAIVLAAGESSRFKPLSEGRHKSLLPLLGKTILEHTLESILAVGIKDILVVASPKDEETIKNIVGKKAQIVLQNAPKGMGDAILQCEKKITSQFFVLNADRFDATSVLQKMLELSKKENAEMVVGSNKTDQPWKYGMLTIKDRYATKVTEKPAKGKEPSDDKIMGIYLLPKDFLTYYKKCREHQYAYEDALSLYMGTHNVPVLFTDDAEKSSAKYSWDILDVAKNLLAEKLENRLEIDPTATIAKGVVIEGPVHIGRGSKIFEHTVIKGPAWIGDNCTIGNNALIRENVVIENGCAVGMGTEVARSVFLENSSIHSGFVGDSVIGENVRIGAGFITANRRLDRGDITPTIKDEKIPTKKTSLGAVIGHNTSIGIMSSTMPGTIVGCNCIIGSNTHVKGTIDSGTTIYSQFEQIIQKRSK